MVLVKKNIDLDAAKNFEKIATSLLKNEAMSYEFRTEVGFIQDRVQEYARKNNILFMVMGKKLVTSYNENLNEFMDQIEVPLVIVPY